MDYVSDQRLYELYGANPTVRIDSRDVKRGDLFVGLAGTRVHGNAHAAAALDLGAAFAVVDDPAVVTPGDGRYLLVANTLDALQSLAASHRRAHPLPTLAITGSNGKTTTKELIGAVLSSQYGTHVTPGNFNNHIGLPLTILATPANTEILVLEMGANHQGEIGDLCTIGRPTHGLITNIGQAHLEGFGGIEGVIAGKGELFDYLATHRGVAFVNADEEYLGDMAARNGRVIFFEESQRPSQEVAAMEIKVESVHPVIQVAFLDKAGATVTTTVRLSGRHNLQNVKAAIAVGKYFKVPATKIAAALAGYQPDNHRSQLLKFRGVDFFWDAYNANPSSVAAALEAFSRNYARGSSAVVLGEMLELGDAAPSAHREIVKRAGATATPVALVGPAMREAAEASGHEWFANSEELARWFWQQHWEGKTVFVKGSRGNKLERLLEEPPVA